MTNSDNVSVTARKDHRCSWCGEVIPATTQYMRWATFDDSVFTNKMHLECHITMLDEGRKYGEYEYTPYSQERAVILVEPEPC